MDSLLDCWIKINNKNSGRKKLTEVLYLHYGIKTNQSTVYEYMKLLGIMPLTKDWWSGPRCPKEYKVKNPRVPNRLSVEGEVYNDWYTKRPLEKLSVDETYIYMDGRWYYLSAIIDAHTGFILSYEIGSYRDTKLALRVLKKASEEYNLDDSILYTDRASCYYSDSFINFNEEKNIVQSMNDRPYSIQNYPIKKFFDIFKNEFLKQTNKKLRTEKYVISKTNEFIDQYNYIRIQKGKMWDGYATPYSHLEMYLLFEK